MSSYKIPVAEIIFRVFSSVKENVAVLIRLGLPVIIVGLLSTFYYELSESEGTLFADLSLEGLLLTTLNIAAYAMTIIGIHQVFLLPPDVVADTSTFRWTMRESRWLGWSVLITFLIVIIFGVLGFFMISLSAGFEGNDTQIGMLIGLIIVFFSTYFIARWSLIFPSVAADGKLRSIGDAWSLSKGNGFRLFILVGLIPMITSLGISFLPIEKSIFLNIAVQVFGWVVATFEVGLLSHSYAFLIGDKNGGDNEIMSVNA